MNIRSSIKTAVRMAVVITALVAMTVYTVVLKSSNSQPSSKSPPTNGLLVSLYRKIVPEEVNQNVHLTTRHLLSVDPGYPVTDPSLLGDGDDDNCTDPRGEHDGYNTSCAFVLDQCQGEVTLIDYMGLILCNLANVEVSRSLIDQY